MRAFAHFHIKEARLIVMHFKDGSARIKIEGEFGSHIAIDIDQLREVKQPRVSENNDRNST